MHIALVSNSDYSFYQFRLGFIRLLIAQGWKVTLVAPAGKSVSALEREGATFVDWRLHRGSMNPWREFRSLLSLFRIYRSMGPVLVHHYTAKPLVYGALAARLAGVPVVIGSLTGLGYVFSGMGWKTRFLGPLLRILYGVAFRWTDRVMTLNPDDQRFVADLLHGPFWRELFHLLYLVSYPLLAGGLILAWWRDKVWTGPTATPDYPRYAFILLGGFLSYRIIFILFPVEGPLDDRFLRFHEQGLIGPLIDYLNRAGHSRGGALPSFEVGGLVISYLLWRPAKPAVRYGLLALIMGITISTTYGAFHYALDAVAGLVTGVLFYLLWDRIYRRLKPEQGNTDRVGGFPAPEPQRP